MKSINFKKLALVAAVTASLSQSILAAGLDARLNTQKVATGDHFQLILSTDDPGGSAPDLSPLTKDFSIQGTSRSIQTQIINGQQNSQRSWTITLTAQKTGTLTIPAISAGNVSSDSTQIDVVDISEIPESTGVNGIDMTVNLADQQVYYMYQEIPLTVRMEVRQPIQQMLLRAPQSHDFELTQMGEDRIMRGHDANIVERDYILRPQVSGKITLPPFVLEGEVINPRRSGLSSGSGLSDYPFDLQQFGFGNMLHQGKPFKVRSDTVTLDISGAPGLAQNNWFLPAKAVHIEAHWQPENPVFRIGEAVTRKISLLALGAQPEQLPELNPGTADHVKMYLDDTDVDQIQTSEGTVARRDLLVSVVPTAAGDITLPEIRVSWLDTQSNEQKEAVLPAVTIQVEGVAGQPYAGAPAANNQNHVSPKNTDKVTEQIKAHTPELANYLIYGAAGFSGFLSLLIAGFWYRKRSATSSDTPDQQIFSTSENVSGNTFKRSDTGYTSSAETMAEQKEKEQLTLLHQAIQGGDYYKIYHQLLSWMRCRTQPLMNAELNQEIAELERVLYTSDKSASLTYNVEQLRKVLHKLAIQSKEKPAKLPPLYPQNKTGLSAAV